MANITRKIALILIFLISCTFAYSNGSFLYEHLEIERLSSFRIQGEIELRVEKDISAPIVCRTLNHEGGMKVIVLEVFNRDEYECNDGMWLYVLLTSPMWVDDGRWIEKNNKFLIFLPNDMPIFDFEK